MRNRQINILTMLLCLVMLYQRHGMAQTDESLPFAEAEIGLMQFHSRRMHSTPLPGISLRAGYQFKSFTTSAGIMHGTVVWNQQDQLNLNNFRAVITGLDFRFRYHLLFGSTNYPMRFFAGAGIGSGWFSSYTDLKDASGRAYILWSDGTLRDMPELPEWKYKAQQLVRDHRYETAVETRQALLYVPLVVGVAANVTQRVGIEFTWELSGMQSGRWGTESKGKGLELLNRFMLGIQVNFSKAVESGTKPQQKVIPYEPGVDPDLFLFGDDDQDGVKNLYDRCPETPVGVSVDRNGCPPDGDEDGVPDYLDLQPDSPKNSWVNEQGIARSDEWIQQQYNDSLSWFSQSLRKVYRNCKPYPVKKFIAPEQYEIYARMLEENPSWRTMIPQQRSNLPAEFKKIDLDNDGIMSVAELEWALNKLFDADPDAISLETYYNALHYAFEVQN